MSEDTVKLKNGTEFYANNGIVGINSDLDIYEGFDGYVQLGWSDDLTVDDKVALAERMIQLWQQYAEKARIAKT